MFGCQCHLERVTIPFDAKVSATQQFTSGLESNDCTMLVRLQQNQGEYPVSVLAEAFALAMMFVMPLAGADLLLADGL